MSAAWIVVVAVGALSIASKAAGPVLIGRRALPPLALRLVELLAPVMLAALVTVQAVGGDREIVLDARLAGLGAAGIALWCRAGLLATMVVAGAAAALARLLF